MSVHFVKLTYISMGDLFNRKSETLKRKQGLFKCMFRSIYNCINTSAYILFEANIYINIDCSAVAVNFAEASYTVAEADGMVTVELVNSGGGEATLGKLIFKHNVKQNEVVIYL
jgi:hypothetical protein